mmetsp:Transcript_57210/g.114792  ORF Transcript_57210/g.114792 Transcript_57210/m.114792 type:complete len:200 (+) Transcript_57210:370-969(+)
MPSVCLLLLLVLTTQEARLRQWSLLHDESAALPETVVQRPKPSKPCPRPVLACRQPTRKRRWRTVLLLRVVLVLVLGAGVGAVGVAIAMRRRIRSRANRRRPSSCSFVPWGNMRWWGLLLLFGSRSLAADRQGRRAAVEGRYCTDYYYSTASTTTTAKALGVAALLALEHSFKLALETHRARGARGQSAARAHGHSKVG